MAKYHEASKLWTQGSAQYAESIARSDACNEWIRSLPAHGSELVTLLARGHSNNVSAADEALIFMFKAESIEPVGKPDPSPSQKFMGHGGMLRVSASIAPPCYFWWKIKSWRA